MSDLKKGVKWFANKSLDLIGMGKPGKPDPEPVVPMPDEELIEQQRRMKDRRRLQSGRQSTILSDGLG